MNTETVQQTSIRFTHTLTVGPLVGVFDPNKFFHDRRDDVNLYVWGDFESRILASARPVSDQPSADLSAYILTNNMYDSEVRAQLPAGYVFNLDDIWMIGAAIALQPKGESGKLLTNGYANLFYVQVGERVFAVDVRWRRGRGDWDVGAWGPGGRGPWFTAGQVFSRNG